ncbi:Quino protein alcohol dehydrogenase-like protein [Cladorrhinum sp. PSN332]|nr:Quino protein alcohol dehydrogenase-like protein [Cladorrhinum sp. PSN332]
MGALLTLLLTALPWAAATNDPSWSGWGGGADNARYAPGNKAISSSSIRTLTERCATVHQFGVTATPVIVGDIAYYPTWDATFEAYNYKLCRSVWTANITTITEQYALKYPTPSVSFQRNVSRTSPQISIKQNILYLATQRHALVVALNLSTGSPLGAIKLTPHPWAVITQSPTLYNDILYVGASSYEHVSTIVGQPRAPPVPIGTPPEGYKCCSFAGNFAALKFNPHNKKFQVLWNITTIPEHRRKAGWSGAGVWGSQPSIDKKRGLVFFGTGNAYSVPQETVDCQRRNGFREYTINDPDPCLPSDVWQDSIVAVGLVSGRVKWVYQPPGVDAHNSACGYEGYPAAGGWPWPRDSAKCPQVAGLGRDFGMSPTFVEGVKLKIKGGKKVKEDVLVVGRKSGVIYALTAEKGDLIWKTATGPGGIQFGGVVWGIAVDGERVYYTNINSDYRNWTLLGSASGNNPGVVTNRSVYGALDLEDGRSVWQIKVPKEGGVSFAPPTVVGDLVLVGRSGEDPEGVGNVFGLTEGALLALNKKTGKVLVDYGLNSTLHSGVAVSGKYLFFGVGYQSFGVIPRLPQGGLRVFTVGR